MVVASNISHSPYDWTLRTRKGTICPTLIALRRSDLKDSAHIVGPTENGTSRVQLVGRMKNPVKLSA